MQVNWAKQKLSKAKNDKWVFFKKAYKKQKKFENDSEREQWELCGVTTSTSLIRSEVHPCWCVVALELCKLFDFLVVLFYLEWTWPTCTSTWERLLFCMGSIPSFSASWQYFSYSSVLESKLYGKSSMTWTKSKMKKSNQKKVRRQKARKRNQRRSSQGCGSMVFSSMLWPFQL